MTRRHTLFWRVVALLAVASVVGFLALRTSPYLQYVPWMPRSLGVWVDSNGIARNVAAFFGFALAAFLLVGRGMWQIAALCAFATSVEVAQLWVRGRVFDWRDIVASIAGILLAWPIAWALRRRSASR